jgi:hypothetical protein
VLKGVSGQTPVCEGGVCAAGPADRGACAPRKTMIKARNPGFAMVRSIYFEKKVPDLSGVDNHVIKGGGFVAA